MNSLLQSILAVGPFGTTELLLILAVVILLFGAKKLPELAKGLGKSIKEFKKASNEEENDESSDKKDSTEKPGSK